MNVVVAGIPVEIVRKRIKNINLRVLQDGSVKISAPFFVSDRQIEMFIESKTDWIKKQQVRFADRPKKTERRYVSGETVFVWGKPYCLQIKFGTPSFALCGENAVLTVKKDSSAQQREKYINEWYRTEVKKEISMLIPKWEKITGLYCSEWNVRYMTSRWGSCGVRTGKILLNVQLAKHPKECLEYVILHELAHLKIVNHGNDFKALLTKYMPNWREKQKRLNSGEIY